MADLAPRPHSEFLLLDAARRLQDQAGQYRGLESAYLGQLQDMSAERRAAGRTLSADFAQSEGTPTNYRTAVAAGLRRARGLSRVLGRSDAGIEAQALRDRISALRVARGRESLGLGGLVQGSRIEAGMFDAQQQANQIDDASRSNLTGSLLGGLLNVGVRGWQYLRNAPTFDPNGGTFGMDASIPTQPSGVLNG